MMDPVNRHPLRVLVAAILLSGPLGAAPGPVTASGPGTGDGPMRGGTPDRNMVSDAKGLPAEWDVKTRKNVKSLAIARSAAVSCSPVMVLFAGSTRVRAWRGFSRTRARYRSQASPEPLPLSESWPPALILQRCSRRYCPLQPPQAIG